jgi:hypothetical protein
MDAGTGHGSVTLHLSRAIQAANPPVPEMESETPGCPIESVSDDSAESNSSAGEDAAQIWQDWRKSRRAIVHSVEISPTYSRHAEKKVVAGFCRGLYSPHIDFHIANVNDWVDEQLEQRNHEPFLSYVFLDMPSSHRYLAKVTTVMKENALIAIFVPSITQIGDCVREIKANGLPLRMEKALELGDGISNGRLWDVRLAFKKARDPIEDSSTSIRKGSESKNPVDELTTTQAGESEEDESVQEEAHSQSETSSTESTREEDRSSSLAPGKDESGEEPVMVCRPKVGERVIGGGFVGLWRRTASH